MKITKDYLRSLIVETLSEAESDAGGLSSLKSDWEQLKGDFKKSGTSLKLRDRARALITRANSLAGKLERGSSDYETAVSLSKKIRNFYTELNSRLNPSTKAKS